MVDICFENITDFFTYFNDEKVHSTVLEFFFHSSSVEGSRDTNIITLCAIAVQMAEKDVCFV